MESENLIWGISLIALTIAVHTMGIVMISLVELKIKSRQYTRPLGLLHIILIVIGIISSVGLMLAILHGIEAAIWGVAYIWLGALDSSKDVMLYSLDQMTTRGASGLKLHPHWRLMGALEAANGMLLFGISTAYIFTLMQLYWPMLSKSFMNRPHP